MKYSMLAYFDKDTQKFNPPMFFPFEKQFAIETIKDGVLKGKIEGAESFDLYVLGAYDTKEAEFELLSKPEKVLTLSDYVKDSKQG